MTAGLTGIVVAGGRASRLDGKLAADLGGRPLVAWPVAAVGAVCDRVAVVCKPETELPPLDAERWDEPPEPRHPLAGIVHALERAGGPILVCAADTPFVTPDELRRVAGALGPGTPAAVAFAVARLQPLVAAYGPEALGGLRAAAPGEPLTRSVERLDPVRVEIASESVLNVNTETDLAEARRRILRTDD